MKSLYGRKYTMHRYFIFLDYLELRRRIEKRLAKANWLLLHSLLFVVVTGVLLALFSAGTPSIPLGFFIVPPIGYAMTAWSVILLLHTLWYFSRSGASPNRRSEMIECEMRERVENQDSYLSDDPKELFRIHGLLDEDLQKRAGVFYSLRLFVTLNLFAWLGSLLSDGLRSSFAWQVVPMLGIAFLPILAFNAWQRGRQEGRVRKLLGSAMDQQADIDRNERLVRLSDDGELIDFEPDSLVGKKKKRDEAG
jgi:Na+/proline symporter